MAALAWATRAAAVLGALALGNLRIASPHAKAFAVDQDLDFAGVLPRCNHHGGSRSSPACEASAVAERPGEELVGHFGR